MTVQLHAVTSTPFLEARLLLQKVLQCQEVFLFMNSEYVLSETEITQLQGLIEKRLTRYPMAYVLGKKEFWSLVLFVDENVLIPRADTEVLIEQALALSLADDASILDLGTGSGAIALALKKEKPYWDVSAIDQSQGACAIAKKNADYHQLSVHIQQSDWFSALSTEKKYHLIVANPPYIDGNDVHLNDTEISFEPQSALVAKDGGLADLKIIVDNAKAYLHNNGYLLLEYGLNQHEKLYDILKEKHYDNIVFGRDLNKKMRYVIAQYKIRKNDDNL